MNYRNNKKELRRRISFKTALVLVFLTVLSCKNDNTTDASVFTEHPGLILTKQGVDEIRANLGSIPMFDKTLAETKEEVDAEIANGFDVPTPKDYSGGLYT